MATIDRYGTTRPDRTPVYVGLGLLLLALVGWSVWAMTARDTDNVATSTTITSSSSSVPATEREVALEAQRRTVTATRQEATAPTIVVEPTLQVVEPPPTTGPNVVTAAPEPRDTARAVSPDPTPDRQIATAETPVPTANETPSAQLDAFVADVREELTTLRAEMTKVRTDPDLTMDPQQRERLLGLEKRVHELEQRVDSLQSAGANQLTALEEELRTSLDDLSDDFDELLSQAGIHLPD